MTILPYMRRLGAVHEPLAARYVNDRTRGLTLKIRRENGLLMLIRLQWLVPPDFHPSTIGLVMVDAKTGECRDYY